VTLHSEAPAPIDEQPIAIHPLHAPLDTLCASHREVVAGTNVAHGAQGYRLSKRPVAIDSSPPTATATLAHRAPRHPHEPSADLRPGVAHSPESSGSIDQQAVVVDAQYAALDLVGAAGRQAVGGAEVAHWSKATGSGTRGGSVGARRLRPQEPCQDSRHERERADVALLVALDAAPPDGLSADVTDRGNPAERIARGPWSLVIAVEGCEGDHGESVADQQQFVGPPGTVHRY
jgi:hypothetical protein